MSYQGYKRNITPVLIDLLLWIKNFIYGLKLEVENSIFCLKMELNGETGQGLTKLPKDILRYIASFNHKYSCSLLKEGEDLYLIIRYADLTFKCPMECIKWVNQEEIRFDLANLSRILNGENIQVVNISFILSNDDGSLVWNFEKKCFILNIGESQIELPSCLTHPLIEILRTRANLEICDHCNQPVKDK